MPGRRESEEETQEFDEVAGEFIPTPTRNLNRQKTDSNKIIVFVQAESGETIEYLILQNGLLKKLMENACQRLGLDASSVKFVYKNRTIEGKNTPSELKILEKSTIEIIRKGSSSQPSHEDAPAQEQQQEDDPADEKIRINVTIGGTKSLAFRQKKAGNLKKLISNACKRFGINETEVAFLFDGERVNATNSPADLGMADDDTIDILQRQAGGSGMQ